MDLHKNLRDCGYGSAAGYVHTIFGLAFVWFLGASVTWIATPCDYQSVS